MKTEFSASALMVAWLSKAYSDLLDSRDAYSDQGKWFVVADCADGVIVDRDGNLYECDGMLDAADAYERCIVGMFTADSAALVAEAYGDDLKVIPYDEACTTLASKMADKANRLVGDFLPYRPQAPYAYSEFD